MLVRNRERTVATVRNLSGDHLEQTNAGGVEVRALICLAAFHLFGRQVRHRADQDAGRCVGFGCGDCSGETEVGHLDSTIVRDQYVFGLDVPMHQSRCVRRRKRLHDGFEEDQGLLGGEGTVVANNVAQCSTGNELHGQVHQSVGLTLVVDRDHVRVGEPGGRLGFTFETGDEPRIGSQVRMHDLQGHQTIETKIDRLVHRRHPAACEKCANLVARANHLADESRAPTRLHSGECRSARRRLAGATPSSGASSRKTRHDSVGHRMLRPEPAVATPSIEGVSAGHRVGPSSRCAVLSLAPLEARILLVDHVDPTAPPDYL